MGIPSVKPNCRSMYERCGPHPCIGSRASAVVNASGVHDLQRTYISTLLDSGAKLAMCEKAQKPHVIVLNAVLPRKGEASAAHVVTATPSTSLTPAQSWRPCFRTPTTTTWKLVGATTPAGSASSCDCIIGSMTRRGRSPRQLAASMSTGPTRRRSGRSRPMRVFPSRT
jgi:hypothetical protein